MSRRIVLSTALAVLVLTAAVTGFFLGSTSGLRFSLRIADGVLPGTLAVRSAQGRLAGDLTLQGVAYRDEEIELAAESFSLSWRPLSLLHGMLRVSSLAVRGLDLRFAQNEHEDRTGVPESLPAFALPLPITLENASLSSLSLFFSDDPVPMRIDRIVLEELQGREDRLRVGGLEAAAAGGRLKLSGELRTSGEYQGEWDGDFAFSSPGFFPVIGRWEMEGPLAGPTVRVDIAAPVAGTLHGTIHDLFGDVRWRGELLASRAGLADISEEWPQVVLANFRVAGSGTLAEYTLQVEADADFAPLTTVSVRGGIVGDAGGLVLSNAQLAIGDASLAAEGRLAWRDAFAWQATLSGERVALTNINPSWPEAFFSRFSIAGQGREEDYSLQVETALAYGRLQDLHAVGTIDGNGSGLRFSDLRLRHRDAEVTGEGQLGWQEGFTWQAAASGTGIDPATWLSQWPGRLEVRITSSGALEGDALQGSLDLVALEGVLRGYPLQATGRVARDRDGLQIDQLSLRSAESILQVSGRYADRVDLDFDLQSPDLASLWPGIGGRLQVRGSLRGNRPAPRLQFDLSAADFSLADIMLNRVDATMTGELAGGPLSGRLRASGATVAGIILDNISADLQGTADSHQLRAEIRAGNDSLRMQAEGGLAGKVWQGAVAQTELKEAHLGSWRLEKPAPLSVSAQASSLQQFCLAGPSSGRICLHGRRTSDGPWRAGAAIETFPLELVPSALLGNGQLEGMLSGLVNAEGDSTGIRRGGVELAVGSGTMTFVQAEESRRRFSWRNIGLNAALVDERLSAEASGLLTDGSTVSASLHLDGLGILPFSLAQSRIDAGAQFEIRDLQPLAAFVYPAVDPSGRMRGALSLQGAATTPDMKASLSLAEAEVRIPSLGIGLQKVEITGSGRYPDFQVGFSGTSGGELRGEGRLSLADLNQPELTLKIRGEEFEAARLPELDLLATPDLELVLRRDRGEARGTVGIPAARIASRDFAGSVSPSTDVVIVTPRQKQAKAGWPLSVDLLVVAGDDVRVDLFGLRGKVTGRLQVVDLPGKPVTGDGILNVVEGTFAVYGRELVIQTGRLVYRGNPIDNPGVEVRAESTSGEVTTGVRVSGFLAAPEISFYADPPMEEKEIITRLLMNTALLGSKEGDRTLLGSSTAGAALDPLTATVRGVKEGLGLDEVKIAAGKNQEDLSLVVGTWLSPDLYISYGKNLLKESGSFNTRYLLGYGFTLETESGATQSGIDLKFEIDRY